MKEEDKRILSSIFESSEQEQENNEQQEVVETSAQEFDNKTSVQEFDNDETSVKESNTDESSEQELNECSTIETEKDEKKNESSENKDCLKKHSFPKKDLGVGGASFIDEFIRTATKEQLDMVMSGKKTLHGFWNWSYSKVKSIYIKEFGRTNGGIYFDVSKLASEYFSDEVTEGDVIEEPKTTTPEKRKEVSQPLQTVKKRRGRKKLVENIVKAAAEKAREENEDTNASEQELKQTETQKEDPKTISYPKNFFAMIAEKLRSGEIK